MRHHHRVRAPPQTPSHRRAAHKGATPRLPTPPRASPRLPTPPCRASSLPAHPRRRRHVCPTACAGASLPPAGPLRADDALAARCHLFAGEIWGDMGRYSAATSSPLALHLPSSPHIPPKSPHLFSGAVATLARAVLEPPSGRLQVRSQLSAGGRDGSSRHSHVRRVACLPPLEDRALLARALAARGAPRIGAGGGQRGGGG